MKYEEWAKLRSKLNHDWLQNRYLTFLKANLEFFDNSNSSGDVDEILEQLLEWEKKFPILLRFIDGTESALEPKQYLESSPLSKLTEVDCEWLGSIVNSLYNHTQIQAKVYEIKEIAYEVDRFVKIVASDLQEGGRSPSMNLVEALLSTALLLSQKISSLSGR